MNLIPEDASRQGRLDLALRFQGAVWLLKLPSHQG